MTKTPQEILTIYKFLESCKYKNISDEKNLYYKSPTQVEQTKSCVCFDGAMYALSKIKQLQTVLTYEPKIFTLKGVRKENGILKNVAHSICIYHYKNKIGAIGKSGSESMQFKEPIYDNLQQLALEFSYNFYQKKILLQSFFIESETNFNILLNETSKDKLHSHNEICNSKLIIPNYLEINQIKQFLKLRYNISENNYEEFINNLRSK